MEYKVCIEVKLVLVLEQSTPEAAVEFAKSHFNNAMSQWPGHYKNLDISAFWEDNGGKYEYEAP